MIDAHCHCHWEQFKQSSLDSQIGFCTYAINHSDWQSLASFDCKYKAFGLHPWHAGDSLAGLEDFLEQAVALGEIGLDYTKDISKQVQVGKFKAQLELANTKSLPVTIHSVGAAKDTLDILDGYFKGGQGRVLFHFANFIPDRKAYLEEAYFSFSKKSFGRKKSLALLDKLAVKNILIETDSFPNKEDLSFCLEAISTIKGISLFELEGIINDNFKKFYQL